MKHFEPLRPFDFNAAESGAVCTELGLTLPVEVAASIIVQGRADLLRMAPLGWLDGLPVYGDHWVYRTRIGDCVQASEMGCPALAIAAGNVRWPTVREAAIAVFAGGQLLLYPENDYHS